VVNCLPQEILTRRAGKNIASLPGNRVCHRYFQDLSFGIVTNRLILRLGECGILLTPRLHRLFGESEMSRKRPTSRKLFGMEALENRELMAGNISYSSATKTLTITGEQFNDAAEVKFQGSNVRVDLYAQRSFNGSTDHRSTTRSISSVQKIVFNSVAGNDSMSITQGTLNSGVTLANTTVQYYAGEGNDTLNNNSQVTTLALGAAGNDTFYGGSNYDALYGEAGTDSLSGNLGNDYLNGGADNDVLHGNNGNDTVYDPSAGTLHGDAGDDIVIGGDNNEALFGGLGNDSLYGWGGTDYMDGGEGNDRLEGGDGADGLYGGNGVDLVYGQAGDDGLYGGFGGDYLYGGDGNDYILGEGDGDVIYGEAGNETIYGGDGNDIIYGGNDTDYIDGQNGNDYLFGEYGADAIRGGAGNDYILGGVGADYLYGDSGYDYLDGGYDGSVDYLSGGSEADTFVSRYVRSSAFFVITLEYSTVADATAEDTLRVSYV
jgi:Ca2+-binding RTX toxin-like protein